MRNLMTACLIAGLVLMLCIGGAAGQFGERVTNSSPEVGLIVENFATVPPIVQVPVTISWLDIGPNKAIFDEGDVLYLKIGAPLLIIDVNDIRLTNSPFGPAGSKVGTDPDWGQLLTPFPVGLPQIVLVDEGSTIGQFDINDSVYIKTFPPAGRIRTGDVRLSPSPWLTSLGLLPGSMVLGTDPDYDAAGILLHPGPFFNLWPILAKGTVRFYNTNGNVQVVPIITTGLSPPIYDEPDVVYFDVSSPSVPGVREFGHITPNAIRLSN